MTEGYDYANLTSDPVPGIEPGTILPYDQAPTDNICPYCPPDPETGEPKKYKTKVGLRGHVHGKHGIRWASKPRENAQTLIPLDKLTPPSERTHLLPWQMIAIAKHELYGLSWKEIAEKMGKRQASTLSEYAQSPAGQQFREHISKMVESPEAIALLLMKAASINVTEDFFEALEWAKDARDYSAVHKMTKDLLQLSGAQVEKNTKPQGHTEYHIHLDSGSLEAPFVTSTFEVVKGTPVDD